MVRGMVLGVSLGLCVLASASPSRASLTWDLKPTGTGDWDWKLGGINGQYDSGVSFDMKGLLWSYAAGHCFEIATGPGAFSPNPDTRIWMKKEDGTWISINDDYNGTLQSKARFWVSYEHMQQWEGYFFTEIRPYSSSGAYDDFSLSVTRLDVSENTCTTGNNGLPWADFKGTGFDQFHLTWGNAT